MLAWLLDPTGCRVLRGRRAGACLNHGGVKAARQGASHGPGHTNGMGTFSQRKGAGQEGATLIE